MKLPETETSAEEEWGSYLVILMLACVIFLELNSSGPILRVGPVTIAIICDDISDDKHAILPPSLLVWALPLIPT
jgi:hypothetical protein